MVKSSGKLTVVGSGIHELHVTAEALDVMKRASKLLYAGHSSEWVRALNPTAENIDLYRAPDRNRRAVPNPANGTSWRVDGLSVLVWRQEHDLVGVYHEDLSFRDGDPLGVLELDGLLMARWI